MKTPTKKEAMKALDYMEHLAYANVTCADDFNKLTECSEILYNFIQLLPHSDKSK